MAADSKTEKNLGQSLTVTRLVLQPKTRLRSTFGVTYLRVFRGPAIARPGGAESRPEAHNYLKVVGVGSLSFVAVGCRIPRDRKRFLLLPFYLLDRLVMKVAWCFLFVFCAVLTFHEA